MEDRFILEGIRREDQACLKELFDNISKGSWSIAKAVDVSEQKLHLNLDQSVVVEWKGNSIQLDLKEAMITPVNISLKFAGDGFSGRRSDGTTPTVTVVLADGRRLPYEPGAISGDGDCYLLEYSREYEYESSGMERYLTREELAGIQYLEIEGVAISVK